ncbi:hypothetical protein LCGC14_1844510, partial [marine sediment metagenome]
FTLWKCGTISNDEMGDREISKE